MPTAHAVLSVVGLVALMLASAFVVMYVGFLVMQSLRSLIEEYFGENPVMLAVRFWLLFVFPPIWATLACVVAIHLIRHAAGR